MDYEFRSNDLPYLQETMKIAREQIDSFERRDDLTLGTDASEINMDDFADSLKIIEDDLSDCKVEEKNLTGLKLCIDMYYQDVSRWIELLKLTKNVKFDWTKLVSKRNVLEYHSCSIAKNINYGVYVF